MREGHGVRLKVHFDDHTPALWSEIGRRQVREAIKDFEWRAFHQTCLLGRKPLKAPLVPFVNDINPRTLPLPLCLLETVAFDPHNLEPSLRRLASFVDQGIHKAWKGWIPTAL